MGVNHIRGSRLWLLLRCKRLSSPLPIFQPPLSTVSHLGPGSFHPDGGFIFVFVCLLIHASSYSGHRRGFRSTTECKSPRRLIHFHPSLVDIQLLSTCPPVSCSQDFSVSFRVQDQACSDQASPAAALVSTSCMSNTIQLPPTFPKIFWPPSICSRLFLRPDPGATQDSEQEESGVYTAAPPGLEGCGSIPNSVRQDMSGFGHQVVTVKQSR